MQRNLFTLILAVACTIAFAMVIRAGVQASPVNQEIGIPDTTFENLQEADCRLCHDRSDQPPVDNKTLDQSTVEYETLSEPPVEDGTMADRLHLLYGSEIPEGTVVPNPDTNNDGIPDTVYNCLSCHGGIGDDDDNETNGDVFTVERDCMQCHQQTSDSTFHHQFQVAKAGDCVACHGDIVDNMSDNHTIRTYDPTLLTPSPSGGESELLNDRGKGAGACDYCHDDGTSEDGIVVGTNMANHHSTGFNAQGRCYWCHATPEGCPVTASFQLNESTGNSTITDESGLLVGTVGNPDVAIPGDGYFHGDEDNDTYIDIEDNDICLLSPTELTIEARVKPTAVDLDWEDSDNDSIDDIPDRDGTFSRIFERKRTIKITILHTNYRGDNCTERDDKASIEVEYFVDNDSRHTCPHDQWQDDDDDYIGNDSRWHRISTDIDQWPIVDNHWYKIKVVFNSDKTEGPPVDIYIDDQGDGGDNETNQLWEGYVNASKSINESSSCERGALPGDFIATENQFSYIGAPSPDGDGTHNPAHIFNGLIDWITWQPVADYSDVDPPTYNGSSSTKKLSIRTCEGCHGFDSLHSIAVDSDGDGELIVGEELPGYSHVGSDSDCWGCHGLASARTRSRARTLSSGFGPVTPYIKSSDVFVVTAGNDTAMTLAGTAFTNFAGDFHFTSDVVLTAADGSTTTLTPDSITQGSLTVTIPGTMAAGNYALRAVKGGVSSNPVVISIKPEVAISNVFRYRLLGIMLITGSGFGQKPEGTDAYINVEKDDIPLKIISWTENRIWAFGSGFRGAVTVNALFGSATHKKMGRVFYE